MRLLTLIVLVGASAVPAVSPMTAYAQQQPYPYDHYPWCAVYGGSMSGSSNCGFKTWQQCMATVSGIGGSCEPNQFYNPGPGKRGRSGKARPRADYPVAPYYGSPGGWSSPSYFYGD